MSGEVHAGVHSPDFERRRIDGTRPVAQVIVDGAARRDTAVRAISDTRSLRARAACVPPSRSDGVQSRETHAVQVVPGPDQVILPDHGHLHGDRAGADASAALELLITTPVRSSSSWWEISVSE